METEPSRGGIADRTRPRIGYTALCGEVPGCGMSATARSLREGLGKVADVVDIRSQPENLDTACDAVLAMECASLVPEPYFIYLCPEQGDRCAADPAVFERAAGLFCENGPRARCLAERTGVPREKIHVIPPAVRPRGGPPAPPRPRRAPRRHLLLHVAGGCGEQVRPQQVRGVLDALKILRQEHDPGISLTISGLRDWPFAGSPPDGVRLHTAPAGEQVALLDSRDLLLVPRGAEFAGLPEALSRGVPCVADRASEMSDAVTPGVTGALVDGEDERELAEAIASVLGDDSLYRQCYEWAPAMAAYFSWERVARQVASVIAREVGFAA